jgi:hypothetical protein
LTDEETEQVGSAKAHVQVCPFALLKGSRGTVLLSLESMKYTRKMASGVLTSFWESLHFPSLLIPHPNRIKIKTDLTLLISNANYLQMVYVEYSLKDC